MSMPYPSPYPQGQPAAPIYPPQYPQAPQQYAPPAAYPATPPAAPQQPLATGTLDDFYNQPSTGGGPSISWKDKPIGTTYAGVVARDVGNGDVLQQVNFQTKQPEFYRDGRPKFVMKVPLRVQPSNEFPEGEAAFYVRGQARDELARAMSEAGVSGAPRNGDVIQVTLVQRKPSGAGMNPSNVVQIVYTPSGAAPVPVPAPSAPAPTPQPVAVAPAPVAAQPVATPAAQVQPTATVPEGFSAEQAALLARLTGQQA